MCQYGKRRIIITSKYVHGQGGPIHWVCCRFSVMSILQKHTKTKWLTLYNVGKCMKKFILFLYFLRNCVCKHVVQGRVLIYKFNSIIIIVHWRRELLQFKQIFNFLYIEYPHYIKIKHYKLREIVLFSTCYMYRYKVCVRHAKHI